MSAPLLILDYGLSRAAQRFGAIVEYFIDRPRRDRNNRVVMVALPYNAPQTVSDRFNRLGAGDPVRVEENLSIKSVRPGSVFITTSGA
jgi:hypothetical protein